MSELKSDYFLPRDRRWVRVENNCVFVTPKTDPIICEVLSNSCGNYAEPEPLSHEPKRLRWETHRIELHCLDYLFVVKHHDAGSIEIHSIWKADN